MTKPFSLLSPVVTTRQRIIVGAWYAVLAGITVMWLIPAYAELAAVFSFAEVLHTVGLLFGLYAAYFALTQFLLMGRISWIEKTFGADHLAAYHRFNGYATLIFIVLHPILIVYSHSLLNQTSYTAEYAATLMTYPFTPLALLGEILFVAVVGSSVYIARKHLRYEAWYGVHLLVYVAIVVSFFHQVVVGDTFIGHPVNAAIWYALYGFVAANIVYFRVLRPVIDQFTHGFVITKVEQTTPSVTSLYITGMNMRSWPVRAGQFVFIRILQKGYWTQEHPFSLSQLPDGSGTFRVSIRASGDYTGTIAAVTAGTRIAVSRPFGRFTHEQASRPARLYVAGGIGVTPLLALARESVDTGVPAALLYANTAASDVPLSAEIGALAARGLAVTEFFSRDPVPDGAHKGYIDADAVAAAVPDFASRDIYVCGPPVMMYGLIDGLLARGIPAGQLHYERYALAEPRRAAPVSVPAAAVPAAR